MPPNNQREKPAAGKSQPSPLADPVVAAIFKDATVSGLAVQSLTNAVLNNKGRPPVAGICSVTPQRTHPTSGADSRFYRIDVEALSEKGENVLIEFQLSPFAEMTKRNLLYCQDLFARWPSRGDDLKQAVAELPRVIAINLLNSVLRPSPAGFHQLAGLFYFDPPFEWATDTLEIHHIQLPLFQKLEPDYGNRLHCWLTALNAAHAEEKSIEEVVKMNPYLQKFRDTDMGFDEFCKRCGVAVADVEVIREYDRWRREQILMSDEFASAEARGEARGEAKGKAEGIAEGIAKGKAEGIAETQFNIALTHFRRAKPGTDSRDVLEMLRACGIHEDVIQAARKRAGTEPRG